MTTYSLELVLNAPAVLGALRVRASTTVSSPLVCRVNSHLSCTTTEAGSVGASARVSSLLVQERVLSHLARLLASLKVLELVIPLGNFKS